jgi:NAD(P)-dependent dehydrogenase (short-subunit alcohol dehydrogenase family)
VNRTFSPDRTGHSVDPMITVVVGAGPGMGMALARRFGRDGGSVALVARRPDALASYVAELSGLGVASRAFPADVGDEVSLRAAFAAIRDELGDPDVLLYNASLNPAGSPAEVSVADVESALRVGAVGALVAAQEVLPAMRTRGSGTVLITGGGLALAPWPGATALGMAKAAVRNLAQVLARDLEGTGVRAGTVTIRGIVGSPGFDPDDIAERFWEQHRLPAGEGEAEVLVDASQP